MPCLIEENAVALRTNYKFFSGFAEFTLLFARTLMPSINGARLQRYFIGLAIHNSYILTDNHHIYNSRRKKRSHQVKHGFWNIQNILRFPVAFRFSRKIDKYQYKQYETD